MQTALTFVAILAMAMLLLCGTRPAFILLAVLAVVSAVCCIMVSFILRKRTDEKNTKDAVLQKKIANWRKVRCRQLRSNADSDDMFDACGITQDLRLALEEGERFSEENHEIEKLEIQISLWNQMEHCDGSELSGADTSNLAAYDLSLEKAVSEPES